MTHHRPSSLLWGPLLLASLVALFALQANAFPCGDPQRQSCPSCVAITEGQTRCTWVYETESCLPEKEVQESPPQVVLPGGECRESEEPPSQQLQTTEPADENAFLNLPLEILQYVLKYLCGKDLSQVMRSCKHLNFVARDLLGSNVFPAKELCQMGAVLSASHGFNSALGANPLVADKFRLYNVDGQLTHMVHVAFLLQLRSEPMTMIMGRDQRAFFERLFSLSDHEATEQIHSLDEIDPEKDGRTLGDHLLSTGVGVMLVRNPQDSYSQDSPAKDMALQLVPEFDQHVSIELNSNWGSAHIAYKPRTKQDWFAMLAASAQPGFEQKRLADPEGQRGENGEIVLSAARFLKYKYKRHLCAVVFVQSEVVHMYLSFECITNLLCSVKPVEPILQEHHEKRIDKRLPEKH